MRKNSGFSLLELLVSMAIFSIVSVYIFQFFAGGLKIYQKAEEKRSLNQECLQITGQMARDLENMVYYDFSGSYPYLSSFEGKEHSLSLILASGSGLKVIRYDLKPLVESKSQFSLQRKEFDLDEYLRMGNNAQAGIKVLSSHIKEESLKFSYAFLSAENQASVWKNEWRDTRTPAGVRIQFELSGLARDSVISIDREVLIPTGTLGQEERAK